MMRLTALLILQLVFTSGLAADYPTRPIRLIVPYPPGGTLDVLARGIGPELTTQLGQPLVIENRSGAAGAIGTEAAAKAAPDGYTLLIGGGSGTAVQALLRNVPYDPVKAFSPIGTLATYPSVLIVNPGTPAKSVQELIALAKASPGKLSYGSPGTGNINNLVGELFKSLAGVDIVHVPYKGAALVITDVDRWARADGIRAPAGRHGPLALRQAAGARGHHRRAGERDARPADDEPSRCARPRAVRLVGIVRAGGDAEGRDRAAERGSQEGGLVAADAPALGRAGL